MTDVILADAEAERQRAANGRPHRNTMQALARVQGRCTPKPCLL